MNVLVRSVPSHRLPKPAGDGVYELALTRGKVAIVDECDVDQISCCSWFAHFRDKNPPWYATGVPNSDKKQIRLHRFILGLQPDDKRQIDHIDGDVSNNRRSNLRVCSNVENNRNRRSVVGNVPFKGVSLKGNKYRASLSVSGRRVYLGTYVDPIDAARRYDIACVNLFGEFACTNASLGLLPSTP